jgi:hypothetical protein
MQFRHFFESGPRFLQGADGPTLCAKTSKTSLRLLAALEWDLSVICALRRMHVVRRALLRETALTTTAARLVTDHGFWERDLSASPLFTTHCPEKRLRKLCDGHQTTRAFS